MLARDTGILGSIKGPLRTSQMFAGASQGLAGASQGLAGASQGLAGASQRLVRASWGLVRASWGLAKTFHKMAGGSPMGPMGPSAGWLGHIRR